MCAALVHGAHAVLVQQGAIRVCVAVAQTPLFAPLDAVQAQLDAALDDEEGAHKEVVHRQLMKRRRCSDWRCVDDRTLPSDGRPTAPDLEVGLELLHHRPYEADERAPVVCELEGGEDTLDDALDLHRVVPEALVAHQGLRITDPNVT